MTTKKNDIFYCVVVNIRVSKELVETWGKILKKIPYNEKLLKLYDDNNGNNIFINSKKTYTTYFNIVSNYILNDNFEEINKLYNNYDKNIDLLEDDIEDLQDIDINTMSYPLSLYSNKSSSYKLTSKSSSLKIKKYKSLSPNYNKYNYANNKINNKFTNFKKIYNYLKNIDDKACLKPIGNNIFSIDDNIFLIKKIGSESTYGINYISFYKDNTILHFCSKIQINNQTAHLENYLLKKITKNVLKNNNYHLPLLYKSILCENINKNDNRYPDLLRLNKNNSHIILFNELADGDLKSFLKRKSINDELWINTIEQIYMCIASLHSLGINHNDCNYGNFLFYKINSGGYFHYNINNEDYYIPNLGYLWVIWDFGVSTNIVRKSDYMLDYNFLNLFLRKDDPSKITEEFKKKFNLSPNPYKKISKFRKWGYIDNNINISSKINKLINNLWIETYSDSFIDYINTIVNKKMNESDFLKNLKDEKILFNYKPLTKEYSNKIFTLNLNFDKIINNTDILIKKENYDNYINIPIKYITNNLRNIIK